MATPNIVPRADSEGGLGTASKYWASAYIDAIYVGAGFVGRDADNRVDFAVDNIISFKANGANRLHVGSNQVYPETNNALSLGYATREFSDLFLGDGAVINFNNGNVTLTHSSNALTLADGDYMQFGSSGDLQIYHSGTSSAVNNTTGHLYISNGADDSDIIFQCDDHEGGVETYFFLDGSRNTSGDQSPYTVFPDGATLALGSDADLRLKHTGSAGTITNNTGDLTIINNTDDGDISFQSDNGSGGTTEYFRVDGGNLQTRVYKEFNFTDNVKASFGSGGDLIIYHDGTNSYIDSISGDTGYLYIRNTKTDGDINFVSDNGAGGEATYFFLDGSSATHDGSATTGLYTNWPDYSRISMGSSHDLQIYHDSTNSNIINAVGNLAIQNNANDGDIKFFSDDGSGGVTEYFRVDGGSETTIFSKPLRVSDNVAIEVGSGADLQLSHNGTNSSIVNYVGDLGITNTTNDADIIFNCDDGSGGTTAYITIDGGNTDIDFHKNAHFLDNVNIKVGSATGGDLQIYHNASHSLISNQTGDLFIRNQTDDGNIKLQADDGSGGDTDYILLDGGDVSTSIKTIKVLMPNLPTSDPSVAGQLWNDSNTLKISAG